MENLQPLVRDAREHADEVDFRGEHTVGVYRCEVKIGNGATHIMKGIIAMAIQPLRVAMGMLCPMAMFGQ